MAKRSKLEADSTTPNAENDMTLKLDNEDGRYTGLTHVDTAGVASAVLSRDGKQLTVTFLKELPPEVAQDKAGHRLIIEGDATSPTDPRERVRTFHGSSIGAVLVVDAETVPGTFEALKGAAGKNVHFMKLG